MQALEGVEATVSLRVPALHWARDLVFKAPAGGFTSSRGPMQEEGVDRSLRSERHLGPNLGHLGIIDRHHVPALLTKAS